MRSAVGAVLVVGIVLSSSPVSAQMSARCSVDDVLTSYTLGRGRNAWARKCGYISAAKENYLNTEGEYQVFYNGCSAYPYSPTTATCQMFVPVSEYDPCVPGLILLGTCVR